MPPFLVHLRLGCQEDFSCCATAPFKFIHFCLVETVFLVFIFITAALFTFQQQWLKFILRFLTIGRLGMTFQNRQDDGISHQCEVSSSLFRFLEGGLQQPTSVSPFHSTLSNLNIQGVKKFSLSSFTLISLSFFQREALGN